MLLSSPVKLLRNSLIIADDFQVLTLVERTIYSQHVDGVALSLQHKSLFKRININLAGNVIHENGIRCTKQVRVTHIERKANSFTDFLSAGLVN